MSERSGTTISCHYDILGVEQDADASTIKKAHRKLALKFHPDKNLGNDEAAEQFRLVQQAYECLSDTQERKWYDEHRDAILAGWSSQNADGNEDASAAMLFNVAPYMYAGCYSGYHNNKGGFFYVYAQVFSEIVDCERKQSQILIELPTEFGDDSSEWEQVLQFYQAWESFNTALNFAWEDKYNTMEEGIDRWVRRRMEEDNTKARRKAKKEYNRDILALVAFCKRRDPRVQAKKQEIEQKKKDQELRAKQEAIERKKEKQAAMEAWREEAQREQEAAEEDDRQAGRVRLADLEDDYDYGGGKKKKGKKKKKKNRYEEPDPEPEPESVEDGENDDAEAQADDGPQEEGAEGTVPADGENEYVGAEDDQISEEASSQDGRILMEDEQIENNDEDFSESESEEEPEIWKCECCKKTFKSEGQMENHMKSKKHKEAFKKYQKRMSQN